MTESQATQPTFALHSLGWKAFQDLCLTVTREVFGQTVEQYASTSDGGRDGAFYGNWYEHDGRLNGSFTIQCKFSGCPYREFP